MFWLLASQDEHGQAAEHATTALEHGGGGGHHEPVIVEFVNKYLGEPVHHLQVKYTQPFWDNIFAKFGTTAEGVFGPYLPETAIPWYTVMFIIACILTVMLIWVLKGQLSEDEPGGGQQVLEASVLTIRGLLQEIVGPHGLKYFPIVATFGILILISNLMGLLPGLMPPTASTSVTFALGISSFVYYNYIGIAENGLFGHLKHFAGPVMAMAPVMFCIELISNMVRPFSLGMRLFGNIFGDEQVVLAITNIYPPYTQWIVPALLMVLGVFTSFMQTFIFMLLSLIYIGEVSHPPHDEHGHDHKSESDIVAPVLT
jgi:F-type H+-transporting ATPase subunit a